MNKKWYGHQPEPGGFTPLPNDLMAEFERLQVSPRAQLLYIRFWRYWHANGRQNDTKYEGYELFKFQYFGEGHMGMKSFLKARYELESLWFIECLDPYEVQYRPCDAWRKRVPF